jgi:hypothetical protein
MLIYFDLSECEYNFWFQKMSKDIESDSSSSSITRSSSTESNDDVIIERQSRVPTRNITRIRSQENSQLDRDSGQSRRPMDLNRGIGRQSREIPSQDGSVPGLGTITITPVLAGDYFSYRTICEPDLNYSVQEL